MKKSVQKSFNKKQDAPQDFEKRKGTMSNFDSQIDRWTDVRSNDKIVKKEGNYRRTVADSIMSGRIDDHMQSTHMFSPMSSNIDLKESNNTLLTRTSGINRKSMFLTSLQN